MSDVAAICAHTAPIGAPLQRLEPGGRDALRCCRTGPLRGAAVAVGGWVALARSFKDGCGAPGACAGCAAVGPVLATGLHAPSRATGCGESPGVSAAIAVRQRPTWQRVQPGPRSSAHGALPGPSEGRSTALGMPGDEGGFIAFMPRIIREPVRASKPDRSGASVPHLAPASGIAGSVANSVIEWPLQR